MKLFYFLGGGGKPRVYLDARVGTVTPGTLIAVDRPQLRAPILTLNYDLQTLTAVSAILGAMAVRKEDPEVYIWDEDKAEPEVAVYFRTKDPDKAVLDDVAGRIGEALNEASVRMGCEQVYTVAEVNLRKADIDKLIREYDAYRVLLVDVRETGQPLDDPSVRRFITRDLFRKEPKLEL